MTLGRREQTTDSDPGRVALVADAVGSYLLAALDVDTTSWSELADDLDSTQKASLQHKV